MSSAFPARTRSACSTPSGAVTCGSSAHGWRTTRRSGPTGTPAPPARSGVLFLSTGPGALTALGALQEAYATGVPLLVIASQVPRSGLGVCAAACCTNSTTRQRRARSTSPRSAATVREAVRDPQPAGRRLRRWRSRHRPGRCGWRSPRTCSWIRPRCPGRSRSPRHRRRASRPRPRLIDAAAAPAEFGPAPGDPGRRRGAPLPGGPAALLALAEQLGAPVVSTVGGKGAIPFDHPLSAASWIEDRYTTDLLEDADVLLAVGTRDGRGHQQLLHLRPARPARSTSMPKPACWRPTIRRWHLHADAAAALSALAEKVDAAPRRQALSPRPRCESPVQDRLAAQDVDAELKLMADLRAAVPAGAHTFWDMTIAGYWAWSAWDPRGGAFHSAQGAGGLGFAFPRRTGRRHRHRRAHVRRLRGRRVRCTRSPKWPPPASMTPR